MTNRIELNWTLDYKVDEQRYYCSETPIDLIALPAPKVVLAGGVRNYADTAIEVGKIYYVCVGSVKNGVEKLSQIKKTYAIPDSAFIFRSPFSANIIDEKGKIWTNRGNAAVSNSALSLPNTGSSVTDYLTTPISNMSQIFSTNDFTMRMKVKLNRTDREQIFASCRQWGQYAGFVLGVVGSKLYFETLNGSSTRAVNITATVSINTTDFFNLSIERKSQKYYLYFNNNLVASMTTTTNIKTPTSTTLGGMALGALSDDNGYFLCGYIKDFELLDYAIGDAGPTTPNF